MALKFLNLSLLFLLVSCSVQFDKEIINHGPNLKSFNENNIKKGETSKDFVIKTFGPPSFTNPYNKKNVYYISHEMIKEIGNVNQFQETRYLEIYYDENDKIKEFYYKKEHLSNEISLSDLNEKSITEDRRTFEFLKNIFSNLIIINY